MAEEPHPVNPQPNPELVPLEQVYPKSKYLPLQPNNFHFDLELSNCHYPIIVEILKKHPIWPAFNLNASVPEVYLQQFFGTLHPVTKRNHERLHATIANKRVSFSCDRLRQILQLPSKDSIPGTTQFDGKATETQICDDIKSLGYVDDTLSKITAFKRPKLAQPWSTLFELVNKCLSGKHTGLKSCSTQFMQIFHGIAFNRHIDFAAIFWKEFKDIALHKGSKKRTFLPYWRFMSLIVNFFLQRYADIPKRPDSELVTPKIHSYTQKKEAALNVEGAIIPEYLLSLADQTVEAIIKYRNEHNLPSMGQQNPTDPTPEGQPPRSEGPERLSKGVQGGVGGSENEGDRGNTDDDDNGDTIIEGLGGVMKERRSNNGHDTSKPKQSEKEQSKRPRKQKSKKTMAKKSKTATSVDTVEVSQEIDTTYDSLVSERHEGDTQTTKDIRTSPLCASADLFSTLVEVAALSLRAHESNLPTHSTVSPQKVVSLLHREQPHNLSALHSEVADIEMSGPPLPLTSHSLHTSSLESIKPIFSESIKVHSVEHVHLRDVTRTFVEASPSDVSRGSEGNHVTVNITPAVNRGHLVEHVSSTVLTGSLSGPGVTVTPEFMAELKQQILREVAAIVKSYKEKAPTPETPLPKSPPRQRQINLPPPISRSTTQSIDELKSLLLAQLFHANPTGKDKTLLELLKDQSDKGSSSGLSDSLFIALNRKMDAQHAQVLAQIAEINKTQIAQFVEFISNQSALTNIV